MRIWRCLKLIENTPLKSVESEIEIIFDSNSQAQVVFDAVNPEISSSPSKRSSMEMIVNGKSIFIKIQSNDSASFRASLNSSIKWIMLSMEVFELNQENHK
jgi:KEOPS complex subunit Pcc1